MITLTAIGHKQRRNRHYRRVWPVAPTSGIGTTVPGAVLDVAGDIATGGGSIKWKTYTGTTAASANTTVAHGLTASKVISVNCSIYGADGIYYNWTYFSSGIIDARTWWDSTNITLAVGSSNNSSRPYRCIAIYIP